MSDIRYEFIMSQIKHIRDIKETEKTKISLVFYEGCQAPCIFKICKDRDLTDVYQLLMEINHPNLATVYDCVYADGNTYVVEEFIQGKTLSEILEEKGTFSEEETIRIMKELCDGLAVLHLHAPTIIHNDIKASNIMLREDGSVKIFDFDISRIYKDGSYKNTKLMGTREYAAPEHYGFGQSEPCTDIYSLGITMHEMLTGQGLNQEHKVTYEGRLASIIQKCVEIDRNKRYASAILLKANLEKVEKWRHSPWKNILAVICGVFLLTLCGVYLNDAIEGSSGEILDSNKEDVKEIESAGSEYVSEDNDSNNDSEENVPDVSIGGVEVIYSMQGMFLAMDVWNDGTFVHLEKISGVYYLKSSDGKENKLEGVREAYGAQLERNPYTDQMYMLMFDYNASYIYEVSKELELTLVKEFVVSGKDSVFFAFYSDGTCVYDTVRYHLSDWSEVESVGSYISPFMIKDNVYSFEAITSVYPQVCRFLQMDTDGTVKNVFSLEDAGLSFVDFFNKRPIYNDSKSVYFTVAKAPHYYVYRFDGDAFIPIKCLSEKNEYIPFGYEELCVTEKALRCYSYPHKAIVEISLE